MRVVIVGAGPAGLLLGGGLAQLGYSVMVVDRDPGPDAGGRWARRGVMQFEHAHGFRAQVSGVLREQWPGAYDIWLSMGAEPVDIPLPGGTRVPGGMLSRRVTFERALRRGAHAAAGLELRHGHVDRLREHGGRVLGCMVEGHMVDADLVVDASGRAGKLGRPEAGVGGDCGIADVNRTYCLLPGASRGPMSSPIAWFGAFDGYLVLLFPHERGHFSLVFVRPTADAALKSLRHDAVFDAACKAIPALSEWTDPARSVPTSSAMAGGALRNTYHPQRQVPGLVAVGDSVSTTAPTAGRGIAMAALQVQELLRLLGAGADPETVAEPFGAWCDREMLPWVADHVATDSAAVARWQGADVDLTRPLPSDLIVAAAATERQLHRYTIPYMTMSALPATLAEAEPLARAVYQTGWRPEYAEGPTRDQLVDLIDATLAAAA
ncbi:MAG: FAD-dependent monooxygenase [Frankiaceae bacterium]